MTACFHRLLLMFSTILVSLMVFNLCGCSRMSGFVMNESGQAYYKHGNYTMARREFQKALMDHPTNPHYAYNLAAATYKQGDVQTAEQLYRHALNLNPSHQPAYHGLATLMMDQGRGQEAEQLLTAWAGSQPYLAEPYVELAWYQRTMGDTGAAEQTLRQALQINPQHERAIAHLGQVFEESGRPNEALAMYQRSLYVNGGQHQVRSRMAALQDQFQQSHPTGLPMDTAIAGVPHETYNTFASHNGTRMGYATPAVYSDPGMMAQYAAPQGAAQYAAQPGMMMASAEMAALPAPAMTTMSTPMVSGAIPAEGDVLPLAGPARMMVAAPPQMTAYAPAMGTPGLSQFPAPQYDYMQSPPAQYNHMQSPPAPYNMQPMDMPHQGHFPAVSDMNAFGPPPAPEMLPQLTHAIPTVEAF